MPDAQHVRLQENSWPHLVAGGAGGIATAIATAPLDVLRTRLQSSLYSHLRQRGAATTTPQASFARLWLDRAKNTSQNLISTQKLQGWRGLYTGLGPSILGIAPATAIKFYTYGNCKRIYANWFHVEDNASSVHTAAAVTAGIVTGTATNPIWLIKTRMQLDNSPSTSRPRHRNSFQYAMQIFKQEGIRGFYRGLSASYLGVAESAFHLVLYERIKEISQSSVDIPQKVSDCELPSQHTPWYRILSYLGIGGSAGIAKLIAGAIAYPHEVNYTDTFTSSSTAQWRAQIHVADSVFPNDLERRRGACVLRRNYTTYVARCAFSYDNAWGIRGGSPLPSIMVIVQ
ncbi:carrier protein Rim2p/Mrs12p [Aureobasidium pullulans]|uniref:Carrier protein Rim2p/Mrs12p n=1 Tax=Aureobasidium pullulans TaxID=5580 RepID=A0A4S9BMC6_AURPU|nr:carrier protein Rim2p/Mrs12p [Aureobasidium pullulans]